MLICVNRCERSSSNSHRQSLNSRSLLYSRCNQALYCRSSSGSDWPEVKSFEFRSSDCSHFRLLTRLLTLPPVGNCVADDSLRASKIGFIVSWQLEIFFKPLRCFKCPPRSPLPCPPLSRLRLRLMLFAWPWLVFVVDDCCCSCWLDCCGRSCWRRLSDNGSGRDDMSTVILTLNWTVVSLVTTNSFGFCWGIAKFNLKSKKQNKFKPDSDAVLFLFHLEFQRAVFLAVPGHSC